jgi:hypothetical protein
MQARKILEREKLTIVHRGVSPRSEHPFRRLRSAPKILAVPRPLLPM